MTKDKKMPKKKKQKDSIGGLIATLARIDKKLDLLNIMSKTMPVMLVTVGGILGSLIYLSTTASVPLSPTELPQTGEEFTITKDFIILDPEYLSSISLPYEIRGLSTSGFYLDTNAVEFFIQKSGGVKKSLGIGAMGGEKGEYLTNWNEATPGQYFVWAEITDSNNVILSSGKIAVNIK